MKKLILVSLVFLVLVVSSISALNETTESDDEENVEFSPATSCGTVITGSIVLTGDLLNCPEHGLEIKGNNIILDCDGHTIDGSSSSIYGILLDGNNGVDNGNTIKNCVIQEFSHSGIVTSWGNSYNTILDNIIRDNGQNGIYLHRSSASNIVGNQLNENLGYGVYLQDDSEDNSIWDNDFLDNNINAYEDVTSNSNNWDNGTIGNFWSDFESNLGYPYNYIISGPGDGIDYYPEGFIPDIDGDGIIDEEDNCVNTANPSQTDFDRDGVGDWCDNCIMARNAGQADDDGDGIGNRCENKNYRCMVLGLAQMEP